MRNCKVDEYACKVQLDSYSNILFVRSNQLALYQKQILLKTAMSELEQSAQATIHLALMRILLKSNISVKKYPH